MPSFWGVLGATLVTVLAFIAVKVYRSLTKELPEGLDLVLIARPSVATASYRDVASDVRKILAAAGMGGGTG